MKVSTAFLLAGASLRADSGGFQAHVDAVGVREHRTAPIIRRTNRASRVVNKTVFSSKMRMVFLVGLEGTGHHFMNEILQRVCESNTTAIVCPDTCSIADALMNGMARANSSITYKYGRERLRNETEALALTMDGSEGVYLATFQECAREGIKSELSFPSFSGSDKPLQYVDLRILAAEAERVGIDLRLVYLGRPARDILISTTVHRHFGSYSHEARVLINNAAVLRSSLQDISPEFITCMNYDDLSSPVQANRVGKFAMPTNEVALGFAGSMLMLAADRAKPSPGLPVAHEEGNATEEEEAEDLISSRLQEELNAIERHRC